MAFDISTAKPVTNQGFDLSTAKPVGEADKQNTQQNYQEDLQPPSAPVQKQHEDEVPAWGREYPNLYGVAGAARETLGPLLEAGGLVGGGVVGGAATPEFAFTGAVPGAGLGYAGAKNILRQVDVALGNKQPQNLKEAAGQTAKDISSGAQMEMGGQILGAGLSKAFDFAGNVIKPAMGRMQGLGTAGIDEAIKSGKQTGLNKNPFGSSTEFDKALRGKITPHDILTNAKDALNTIKENMNLSYQEALSNLSKDKQIIDLQPLKDKAYNLLRSYVKFNKDGTPNWDRTALGKEGTQKAQEIMQKINSWGSVEGDATPIGLDLLKRDLDNFYSESSNARAFVTSLRNIVKDTLVKKVPEYANMTKDYAKTTNMIKDIEAGLMMRKQGMTGRVVADQTLRRLMSSMKDNFHLRAELVKTLGSQGGKDLLAQIAGASMRNPFPHGLAGTGPVMMGEAALAHLVNPNFWPLVAASSPRLSAEFLRMFGKVSAEMAGSLPLASKIGAMKIVDIINKNKGRNQ